MALVGHISGSAQTNSQIGITGSVVFANRPASSFPIMPGADVVLFVSGNAAAKPAVSPNYAERGTTVFGGDVVISGSLFGGSPLYIGSPVILAGSGGGLTGSITKLSDGTSFIEAGENVTVVTGSNGRITISSTATGGGAAGLQFFSSTTNGSIFTTGSTAFVGGEAGIDSPADKGADVFFFVSGSTKAGEGVSLFGGALVASGNLTTFGDLGVNGGDLTTTSATFNLLNSVTTLNVGTAATTVNIGQAANETNIGGNLTVNGNLTVSGDVVAVDATHLRVEDRVVLIASGGSPGANRVSAIGFASGSASGIESLIVGPVGSSDAVGFAKQDIRDGTLAASSLSFAGLIPVKASRFDAGYAGTAFLTSSAGTDATLKATAGAVILDGAANNGTSFYIAGTPYAALTDNASSEAQLGAVGGKNLNLSGSQVIQNAGTGGSRFHLHGTEVARLSAATTTAPVFRAAQSNATLTLGTNGGGSDFLVISGSTVRSNSGNSGFFFQRHGVNHLNVLGGAATTLLAVDGTNAPINLILSGAQNTISSNGGTTQFAFAGENAFSAQGDAVSLSLVPAAGRVTANVFNTVSTTVNFAAAASTALNIGNSSGLTTMQGTVSMAGSLGVVGLTSLSGSVVLGDTTGDNVTFTGRVNSHVLPASDILYDLGSPTNRWANMYTGDLHLKNERGDWTIIEESDFLTITNNKNGKRYKFVLEEIG